VPTYGSRSGDTVTLTNRLALRKPPEPSQAVIAPQVRVDATGGGSVTVATTTIVIDISTASDGADCYAWIAWAVNGGTFSQTGWTEIAVGGPASTSTEGLFYRRKVAGDTTFTFTVPSAKGSWGWIAYSGLDPTTPHQTAGVGNYLLKNVASVNVVTPSITNSNALAWAVGFYAQRSVTVGEEDQTFTPDAAMVKRVEFNNKTGGSVWHGIGIHDTNGQPVTAAAHSYTAVASFSEQFGGAALLYLNPADTAAAVVSGDVSIPLSFNVTSDAVRTANVDAVVPLSFTVTSNANLQRLSDVSVPLSFNVTSAATRTANVDASVPLSFNVTATAALLKAGDVSVPLSFNVTATAQLIKTADVSVPLSLGITSAAVRQANANVSVPFSLGITSSANLQRQANVSVPLSFAVTATAAVSKPADVPVPFSLNIIASIAATMHPTAAVPLSFSVIADATVISVSIPHIPFSVATRAEYSTDYLWGRYAIPTAGTLIKKDGHWYLTEYPLSTDLVGVDGVDYLRGGYDYLISSATAAELTVDGFLEGEGFGGDGFGDGPFGG